MSASKSLFGTSLDLASFIDQLPSQIETKNGFLVEKAPESEVTVEAAAEVVETTPVASVAPTSPKRRRRQAVESSFKVQKIFQISSDQETVLLQIAHEGGLRVTGTDVIRTVLDLCEKDITFRTKVVNSLKRLNK